jgi:tripartite-type tricarboxylate transporter receptor subunit TctC
MVAIFKRPEVQTRLTEMGAEFAGSSPAELDDRLALDVRTWATWVKEVGVRAD